MNPHGSILGKKPGAPRTKNDSDILWEQWVTNKFLTLIEGKKNGGGGI